MQSKHLHHLIMVVLSWSFYFTASAQVKPVGDSAATNITAAPKEEEDKIFVKIEVPPSVEVKPWQRHLEARLFSYIESALKEGISTGKYTIMVRFLVELDGKVTEVKALNDPGYGLAKGAETIVKTGPKWRPGEVNGQKVRAYRTQPITFVIQEEVKYD